VSARRVILLRHGQTAYNAEARFQGQLDVPLDEVGLGQAKRVADTLATELAGSGPVRVLSSDLSRAAQTAEVMAARLGVDVAPEPRLREIYAGQWQGLLREEIVAGWPEDYRAWRRGDADIQIGGGESRAEAGLRASAAITEAAQSMDDGTLICVSHGGSLRAAIFLLLGVPSFPWNALVGLRNAHWAELQQTSGGWRLSVWNIGSGSER